MVGHTFCDWGIVMHLDANPNGGRGELANCVQTQGEGAFARASTVISISCVTFYSLKQKNKILTEDRFTPFPSNFIICNFALFSDFFLGVSKTIIKLPQAQLGDPVR